MAAHPRSSLHLRLPATPTLARETENMKLSFSVPDALWLRARETYPIFGDSRLVQVAMEYLIADSRPNYLEGPPPESADRLRCLRARLSSEAQAAFESGYDAGLGLAEVLDWWILDRLATAHWRLDDLLSSRSAHGLAESMRGLLVEREDQACAGFVAELERDGASGRNGDLRRVATFASGLVLALRHSFEAGAAAVMADDAQGAAAG